MNERTEYQNPMMEKCLEENIIVQAQALNSENYSLDQRWDVVIAKEGHSRFRAYVICYKGDGGNDGFDIVETRDKPSWTRKGALEDLLELLQLDFDAKMKGDEVR
ncbi:hypothetical protein ACEQ8H_001776 [Pleosporales sp. CAS-2024a]